MWEEVDDALAAAVEDMSADTYDATQRDASVHTVPVYEHFWQLRQQIAAEIGVPFENLPELDHGFVTNLLLVQLLEAVRSRR